MTEPPPLYKVISQVTTDPRYLRNVGFGEPRPGHPEGSVREHIAQLKINLAKISDRLSETARLKLLFMIHVHDTFKLEAEDEPEGEPDDPNRHSKIAFEFARDFVHDTDLLSMILYHDENWALWKQLQSRGYYDNSRFKRVLNSIEDWDLFLVFMIIDGATPGKDHDKLRWFLREIGKHRSLSVDETWIDALL